MICRPQFCFLMGLVCQAAYPWGHANHLNTDWASSSLSYVVNQTQRLHYCVKTELPKQFPERAMATEVREALRVWLVAAKRPYLITALKVDCSDSRLNLMVRYGPDKAHPDLSAYEQPQLGEFGYYSLIQINTSFRYQHDKKTYRVRNTAEFMAHGVSTDENIRELAEKKRSIFEMAKRWNTDYLSAYFTSYKMLLHELGHSFGLCDEQGDHRIYCDPENSALNISLSQQSLMDTAEHFFISPDDQKGLKNLFTRFKTCPSPSQPNGLRRAHLLLSRKGSGCNRN